MSGTHRRCAGSLGAAALVAALLAGCGADSSSNDEVNEMIEVTETAQPSAFPTVTDEQVQELWLDRPAASAAPGGVMKVADDEFRLGLIDIADGIAKLQIIHRDDESLEGFIEVERGSVFDVGEWQVLVGSVREDFVLVNWRSIGSGSDG